MIQIANLQESLGGDYDVISYSYHAVVMQHKCGNKFTKSMNQIKKKPSSLCPSCYIKGNDTPIAELIKAEDVSYELVEGYSGNVHTACKLRHKECGEVSDVTMYSFLYLHGSRCKCPSKYVSKPNTDSVIVLKYLKNFFPEFKLYKSGKIFSSNCNHMVADNILAFITFPKTCPVCNDSFASSRSKNSDQINAELEMLFGGAYRLTSNYVNNKMKVSIIHSCGTTINVRYNDFLLGRSRCSKCSTKPVASRKFTKVIEFLATLDIQKEFTFADCKYKKVLPFDYAIFSKGKLKCLVELQGDQHFKNSFGSEEKFAEQLVRDKIKYDYAKKHKIPLFYFTVKQTAKEHNAIINSLADIV